MNKFNKKKIAECVGLWLAEGDNKSLNEITFTNNCWSLIKMFYTRVIHNYKGNPRIYVYSNNEPTQKIQFRNCKIKYYTDKRAKQTYYILRLASVVALKNWRKIVKKTLNQKKLYPDILRGFFAGEGNIKNSNSNLSHNSKAIRIAQKTEKEFINKMLNSSGLSYSFRPKSRVYEISGKWNWNIFAKYKLAELHPDKKKKFLLAYKGIKEEHYPTFYIKNLLLKKLDKPMSSNQLSLIFNRSQARICDVLMELKKENKIKNFKMGSIDYWTNKEITIISKIKYEYLKLLEKGFKRTADFANCLKVDWKSSFKRLKGLEKLGLVQLNDGNWQKLDRQGGIMVL